MSGGDEACDSQKGAGFEEVDTGRVSDKGRVAYVRQNIYLVGSLEGRSICLYFVVESSSKLSFGTLHLAQLLLIYTYAGRVGGRKKRSAPAYIYSFYSYHTTMKTPIISSSAAAQSSVPSLIFRAYTVKELACLYFPQKTATGASRSLRALIRHDPELLSQLRAQGYRPRVHYLPPSAVQVLLEHLGTPEEFYEILRKA